MKLSLPLDQASEAQQRGTKTTASEGQCTPPFGHLPGHCQQPTQPGSRLVKTEDSVPAQLNQEPGSQPSSHTVVYNSWVKFMLRDATRCFPLTHEEREALNRSHRTGRPWHWRARAGIPCGLSAKALGSLACEHSSLSPCQPLKRSEQGHLHLYSN